MMKLTKEVYKLNEVQELLQVTQRTIYRYIDEGKLEAYKVGGQWRVDKTALQKFIKGGK